MIDKELKQQLDEAARRSLTRAGIGKVFHDRKLKEFGEAGAVLSGYAKDVTAFRSYIRSGGGYSLECVTHRNFDLAYILGRAMRLKQIDVRVAGVIDLIKYTEAPNADYRYTRMEDFDNAQALVIPRFYEPGFTPYEARELQHLEYYLIQRINSGFSISIQYQGNLREQKNWSPYFIDLLAQKNEKVLVQ